MHTILFDYLKYSTADSFHVNSVRTGRRVSTENRKHGVCWNPFPNTFESDLLVMLKQNTVVFNVTDLSILSVAELDEEATFCR